MLFNFYVVYICFQIYYIHNQIILLIHRFDWFLMIIFSGFKPKSFHSSRKNRQRDLDEKFAQHPEDFMDDEVRFI